MVNPIGSYWSNLVISLDSQPLKPILVEAIKDGPDPAATGIAVTHGPCKVGELSPTVDSGDQMLSGNAPPSISTVATMIDRCTFHQWTSFVISSTACGFIEKIQIRWYTQQLTNH